MVSTAVSPTAVVLLLLIHCNVLLPLFVGLVFGTFVMQYLLYFLVLQESRWGRESWLLYFDFVLAVLWLLVLCVSSSWCCGLVFGLWL